MKRAFLLTLWLFVTMPSALAQGGPCADDVRRFCQGTRPGSPDFRECMRSHREELSAGCRNFIMQKMGPSQPAPAPTPARPDSAKVLFIDTHVHLDGKIPDGGSDFEGAVEKALKRMEDLGVSMSLIMPPPLPHNSLHLYDYEDFLPAIKKHPKRFAFLGGGGSLNPMIQEAVAAGATTASLRLRFEQRARKIVADGAAGFGEMTAEHFSFNPRHPYEAAPADHPLFLLLADIAAEAGVPIDLHMEAVADGSARLPDRFQRPTNPDTIGENIRALERLLEHNRKARIVWVHAGWDNTGQRTAALTRTLLNKHPNLTMSLKIDQLSLPSNRPLKGGGLDEDWLKLLTDFPDRFVLGTDSFYSSPRFPLNRPAFGDDLRAFLDLLPAELARRIAVDNVRNLYPLAPFRE